mgnify:CR=1 FL=1
MAKIPQTSRPSIFLSDTDPGLDEAFSNGYEKYKGFQEMAGGGAGILLSSYDNNLRRKVAIKKLKAGQQDNSREQQRLIREARITAQLSHPNTVPVYEMGIADDGEIYFAMKKIEGSNLFQILCRIAQGEEDAKQEFTLYRLLSILIQASNALAYAHARGVIHRDVKPENVLVGLFGEVYMMDWGVAKVWGMPNEGGEADFTKEDVMNRLTASGKRPGTPLYMSPEQVQDRPIDERTDIFSMGVVLYETLALREPFRGARIKDTFGNILNDEPPPPSTVSQHLKVPKRLDEICAKAMQKKPGDRYQSMLAFVKDIREFREAAMTAGTREG